MTDFLKQLAQKLESSDWSVQHKNGGLVAKKRLVSPQNPFTTLWKTAG